jgi:hypothetical protein
MDAARARGSDPAGRWIGSCCGADGPGAPHARRHDDAPRPPRHRPGPHLVRGLQERIERASLSSVFLIVTAVYFVVRTVIDLLITGDGLSVIGVVLRLVGSLLFGGAMVAVVAWQRRRNGGASTSADITAAIRTGTAPLAADPAVWIPALEWRRGQFRRSVWLTPLVLLVFVAMGIALVVLDPGSPVGWFAIVVLVGLGIGVVLQARRALPRIEALLQQVRERDDRAASSSVPASPPSGGASA